MKNPEPTGGEAVPQQEAACDNTVKLTITIVDNSSERVVDIFVDKTCEYLPGGRLEHLGMPQLFPSIDAAFRYLMPDESRASDMAVSDDYTFCDPSGQFPSFSTARGLLYAIRYGI